MRAARIKHYDNSSLHHPWLVSFARSGGTYLYGEEAFLGSIAKKRAAIFAWCDDNGVTDFTVSESGSTVAFLTEGEAFLFYLAHA